MSYLCVLCKWTYQDIVCPLMWNAGICSWKLKSFSIQLYYLCLWMICNCQNSLDLLLDKDQNSFWFYFVLLESKPFNQILDLVLVIVGFPNLSQPRPPEIHQWSPPLQGVWVWPMTSLIDQSSIQFKSQ